MVMVQAPTTAQYGGMPRSAIGTDVVDYVLPVVQMPAVLLDDAQPPYVSGESPGMGKERLDYLHRILAVVQTRTSHNFSYYKHSTLLRCIDRRMGVRHIEQMGDYLQCRRTEEHRYRRHDNTEFWAHPVAECSTPFGGDDRCPDRDHDGHDLAQGSGSGALERFERWLDERVLPPSST